MFFFYLFRPHFSHICANILQRRHTHNSNGYSFLNANVHIQLYLSYPEVYTHQIFKCGSSIFTLSHTETYSHTNVGVHVTLPHFVGHYTFAAGASTSFYFHFYCIKQTYVFMFVYGLL